MTTAPVTHSPTSQRILPVTASAQRDHRRRGSLLIGRRAPSLRGNVARLLIAATATWYESGRRRLLPRRASAS